jgi:recombinational DNA repair protein (RecF pathway)
MVQRTDRAAYRAYDNRHHMVKYKRGRAREHSCADCGGQAQQWATIHGRDGRNPEDYRPLCIPCHWRYDGYPGRAPGERNANAKLTNEQVLAIWERRAERQADLAREFRVTRQAVNSIVRGRGWQSVTGAVRQDRNARGNTSSEG